MQVPCDASGIPASFVVRQAVPVGPLAGPKHARATKSGKWMYWGDEASQTEQANRELISQVRFGLMILLLCIHFMLFYNTFSKGWR